MANTDWAFGFLPWQNVLRAQLYTIVTAPTIGFYHGDMVRSGALFVTTPHGYLMAVEDGAVADGKRNLLGSILAVFDEDMDPVKYIVPSEAGNSVIAGYLLVADHPHQLFVGREDFNGNAIDLTEGGWHADLISVALSAGNTKTGRSTVLIDSTSAANASAQLQLLFPHPDDSALVADDTPGDTGDEGCRYIVQITEHQYSGEVAIVRDVE